MAGIKTSIELFDNFSSKLNNIVSRMNVMTSSAERVHQTLDKQTNYARDLELMGNQLEVVGMKYAKQVRVVQDLNKKYQESIQLRGKEAEITQKLENKLLNARMSEIKLEQAVEKTGRAYEKLEQTAKKAGGSIEENSRKQEKFNNSISKGVSETEGLYNKIKKIAGAYVGFQAIKKGLEVTVGGAGKLQQQMFAIRGIMGNKKAGAAYFDVIKKKANDSIYSLEDFAGATRRYLQFTKNTKQLDKLNNLSERLTLIDPMQGFEGASFAMKEALSGDFTSLKERFGFGKVDAEILKASKSMDDFISKFDILLNKKGFDETMLAEYNKSAIAQFDNLKSNVATGFAETGEGALNAVMPVITLLNQAFSSGAFQPLFDTIAIGLSIISNIAVGLVSIIQWIGQSVIENWNIIGPILAFVAGVLLVLLIQQLLVMAASLWQTIQLLAAKALMWLLTLSPIALVIGAIMLLIYVLIQAGVTAEQIVGGIAGAFMVAVAFIGNLFITFYNLVVDIVAILYNNFATFAEFLANVFNDPIGSIVRLFAGMADSVLGILEGIASAIDTVFGSNLASAVNGWRGGLDGAVKKLVGDAKVKIPRMDSKSIHLERLEYGKAFNTGYNKGAGATKAVGSKLGGMLNGLKPSNQGGAFDFDKWNKAQGPGELAMAGDKAKKPKAPKAPGAGKKNKGLGKTNKGIDDANKKLGGINDKIDISNEHLEIMRDLAEMESIQNFVTLTPSVSIQTGDIKEEADINKIISKIETYMENELKSSAEGVYT